MIITSALRLSPLKFYFLFFVSLSINYYQKFPYHCIQDSVLTLQTMLVVIWVFTVGTQSVNGIITSVSKQLIFGTLKSTYETNCTYSFVQ